MHDSTRLRETGGGWRDAGAGHRSAQQPAAVKTKEAVKPVPVRVGMTDWNLGQRGDIAKIALAREIGLDGIQVSVQYPTDGKTPTLRDREDAGGVQARRARERHPDLFAGDRQSRQVAAADAHQCGLRHPAGRGRRDCPQPGHQQHPAADPRRQPHRHDQPLAGRHLRRDDEGGVALRREVRRGRRSRGLDLGRGQHQAARRHRLGLRRRLLRCPQHRAAREGHLRRAEDARQAHSPDPRQEREHAAGDGRRPDRVAADGGRVLRYRVSRLVRPRDGLAEQRLVADTGPTSST